MRNYLAVLDWSYWGGCPECRPDLDYPGRFPAAIQFEAENRSHANVVAVAYAREIASVPVMVRVASISEFVRISEDK